MNTKTNHFAVFLIILLSTGVLAPWEEPPTLEDDGVEVVGAKSAEELKPSIERVDLTRVRTPVRLVFLIIVLRFRYRE